MANNKILKDDIASVIRTNNKNEITGALLQSALFSIINQFGSGCIYKGVAKPDTNPKNTDINAFYLASSEGLYPNFGNARVKIGEMVVFSNISGLWEKENLVNINSILKIEKTSSKDFIDIYTIFFTNGSSTQFSIQNSPGLDVENGALSYNTAKKMLSEFMNPAENVKGYINERIKNVDLKIENLPKINAINGPFSFSLAKKILGGFMVGGEDKENKILLDKDYAIFGGKYLYLNDEIKTDTSVPEGGVIYKLNVEKASLLECKGLNSGGGNANLTPVISGYKKNGDYIILQRKDDPNIRELKKYDIKDFKTISIQVVESDFAEIYLYTTDYTGINSKKYIDYRINSIEKAFNKISIEKEEKEIDLSILNNIAWIDKKGVARNKNSGNINFHSDFIYVPKGSIISGNFYLTTESNGVSFYYEQDEKTFVKGISGKQASNSIISTIEFKTEENGYIRIFSSIFENKKPDIHISIAEGEKLMSINESIETSKKWNVFDAKHEYAKKYETYNFKRGWISDPKKGIEGLGTDLNSLVSDFIPIEKGKTYYYHLYGNWELPAILFYSDKFFGSYANKSINYEKGGDYKEISGKFEADQNGYVVVIYTYSNNSPLDKIYFGDKKRSDYNVSVDAQFLYNKVFSKDKPIKDTFIRINEMKYGTLYINGPLPTDVSVNREKTSQYINLYDQNNNIVLECKSEMRIQGSARGSANYAKKGYTLDLFNSADQSLNVKIGDFVTVKSFHLKAYYTDRTHTRDVASSKLWHSMISSLSYPLSKVNNKAIINEPIPSENESFTSDACYFPNGFPVAVYSNNEFLGLYTMRLKKARENYALDRKNKEHIFLDSATYDAKLDKEFNYIDWDVKSPKMKGYEEQQEIPNSKVSASIDRLFSFTTKLREKKENHADFIVLPHWIHYVIFSELIGNWDVDGNNVNLLTWNNKQWSIIPYDLDQTIGLENDKASLVQTGMLMRGSFWNRFKSVFLEEIKKEYTNLRNLKILSMQNISSFYINHSKYIPRHIYYKDFETWGAYHKETYPTVNQIINYLDARLTYLDSQWKL